MLGGMLGDLTISAIMAIVAAITGLLKTFKFVQEGSLGIKLRFGKAVRDRNGEPKIMKPGILILVPFIENLRTRHVRQQTLHFDRQRILLKDGLIFTVSAIVLFRVTDVYKALFEIDDLDQSVNDLCMSVLREELSQHDHGSLAEQQEQISEKLLEAVKEFSEKWGIEFVRFSLTDCAPTPETANLINAEVGASLRVKALQEAAKLLDTEVSEIDHTFAAVLVGFPLVASLQGDGERTLASSSAQEG